MSAVSFDGSVGYLPTVPEEEKKTNAVRSASDSPTVGNVQSPNSAVARALRRKRVTTDYVPYNVPKPGDDFYKKYWSGNPADKR